MYWIYGCRPAAHAWEDHYAMELVDAGFTRGCGSGVVFYHEGRDLSCLVHGDDFIFVGDDGDLDWIQKLIKKWFEVKVRGRLGEDANDQKEMEILGRTITWTSKGLRMQADKKHRKRVLDYFGFNGGSRSLTANGEKEKADDDTEGEVELERGEAKEFRGMAALLNYYAQDCPDVQFPAKEISRDMARPRVKSWAKVKRMARYLLSRLAVVWEFDWQSEGALLRVLTDSDWGGSREDRKSTSGGALLWGGHCWRTWSTTQGAVALSSAEAEFYAMVDGVQKAKWAETVAREMGIIISESASIVLGTDSKAAQSFVARRGLGRMRHIEVRDLWLQEQVRSGKVKVEKVLGTENAADLMTKFLSKNECIERLRGLAIEWCAA